MKKEKIVINNQLISYHHKQGKGETILFLHGWRSSADAWSIIIDKLSKENINIYALDLPGFGKSDNPKTPFKVSDYSEIIKDFLDKKQLREVVVVGHSFGGRISIHLAANNPGLIDKLVLVDSAGFVSKDKKTILTKGISRIVGPFFRPKFMQNLRKKIYRSIGAEDYTETPELKKTFLNIINEDLERYLPRIKNQTFIIWGENDKETPLLYAHKMNDKIPNSKLRVLENAGHFSFIDNPELFSEKIINFIKQ